MPSIGWDGAAPLSSVKLKTDLQPLINDGAAKPDLAASIFTAVATQTIAGLPFPHPANSHIISV